MAQQSAATFGLQIELNLAKKRIAELEQQLTELREAARAVVETDADARRQQVTHWKNPTIDALAALLEEK